MHRHTRRPTERVTHHPPTHLITHHTSTGARLHPHFLLKFTHRYLPADVIRLRRFAKTPASDVHGASVARVPTVWNRSPKLEMNNVRRLRQSASTPCHRTYGVLQAPLTARSRKVSPCRIIQVPRKRYKPVQGSRQRWPPTALVSTDVIGKCLRCLRNRPTQAARRV